MKSLYYSINSQGILGILNRLYDVFMKFLNKTAMDSAVSRALEHFLEDLDRIHLVGYRMHIASTEKLDLKNRRTDLSELYGKYDEFINKLKNALNKSSEEKKENRVPEYLMILLNPTVSFRHLYNWTAFGLYFFRDNRNIALFYGGEALRRDSYYYPWTPLILLRGELKTKNKGDSTLRVFNMTRSNPYFFSIIEYLFEDFFVKPENKKALFDKLVSYIKNSENNNRNEEKELISVMIGGGWNDLIDYMLKYAPGINKEEERRHIIDCIILRFLQYYYIKKTKGKNMILVMISVLHEPLFSDYYKQYIKRLKEKFGIKSDIKSFYGTEFHYSEFVITPEFFIDENYGKIKNSVTVNITIDRTFDPNKPYPYGLYISEEKSDTLKNHDRDRIVLSESEISIENIIYCGHSADSAEHPFPARDNGKMAAGNRRWMKGWKDIFRKNLVKILDSQTVGKLYDYYSEYKSKVDINSDTLPENGPNRNNISRKLK